MRRLEVCAIGLVTVLIAAPVGAQNQHRPANHRDRDRGQVMAAHYRLAAERGSALGMCRLGDFFLAGHGVERSAVEAYRWYIAALHATAAGESIAGADGFLAEERRQCDRNRKHAASLLTRSERADADRSARAWLDAVLGVRVRE